jgi:hypothetical protein
MTMDRQEAKALLALMDKIESGDFDSGAIDAVREIARRHLSGETRRYGGWDKESLLVELGFNPDDDKSMFDQDYARLTDEMLDDFAHGVTSLWGACFTGESRSLVEDDMQELVESTLRRVVTRAELDQVLDAIGEDAQYGNASYFEAIARRMKPVFGDSTGPLTRIALELLSYEAKVEDTGDGWELLSQ